MAEDILQPVEKLELGMTIAQDVLGPSGVPLVRGGAEVTDEIINWLKRLDIKEVWVRGREKKELSPEEVEALRAELDARFFRVAGDPIMDELKEAVFRFLTEAEA